MSIGGNDIEDWFRRLCTVLWVIAAIQFIAMCKALSR
jgi:hypothetical protein